MLLQSCSTCSPPPNLPGITIQHLHLMMGIKNAVFFDNVRVPKSHVVGTVNRGWDVAKYLLQHERAMISGTGERGIGRPLGQVAADSVGSEESGRLDDAMLRSQVSAFDVDEAAFIVDVIKSRIEGLAVSADIRNQGTVVSVTDGICRIHGLSDAMQGEMLEFPNNTFGLALNLERDSVGAVIMGAYEHITEGDIVKCTGRILEVPIGPELIGRVVNAIGEPIVSWAVAYPSPAGGGRVVVEGGELHPRLVATLDAPAGTVAAESPSSGRSPETPRSR